MIERCSPVEMRKNLLIVDKFKSTGIDFVVMPVLNKDHRAELEAQSELLMIEMVEIAEASQPQQEAG